MGATAADQLISQLQRGDFGVPEQPMSVLVSGIWQKGAMSGATETPAPSPTPSPPSTP
jgi:hypothetical protein